MLADSRQAPLLNLALMWVFAMIMALWGEALNDRRCCALKRLAALSFVFFLFSYRHLATPGQPSCPVHAPQLTATTSAPLLAEVPEQAQQQ